MSSTVKNPWLLVLGTFVFSLLLFVLPSIVFGPEIKAVDAIWYYVALRVLCVLVFICVLYRVIVTREQDNSAVVRVCAIAIAVIYFIITMAGAAQYRSDKSDGIQFDKTTAN